jgi:hypothetical protein
MLYSESLSHVNGETKKPELKLRRISLKQPNLTSSLTASTKVRNFSSVMFSSQFPEVLTS